MNNSLTQYIDFFREHREVIDAHSPAILNSRRDAALSFLVNLGRLPERGDEGYPKISLNEMFEPDYGFNISRISFGKPEVTFGCDHPVSGRPAAMFVNDTFSAGNVQLPAGVEILTIKEAAEKYPRLIERQIAPADNPVVAINDLMAQDGAFILIKSGSKISKPIQILSVFNGSQPMMGVRKVIIHVEDGASASVMMCDHPVAGAADHLSCRVVEATIGRDASLRFYDLEEAESASRRATVFAAEQSENSVLKTCGLFLNGGMTRNEFYPKHLAEHCTTHLGGLVIGAGRQTIDNSVVINHTQPGCSSEQLFKYALFDAAQGSFEGMVKVSEGAVKTDAHQSNRNLLASADARMYAMPQLEIYCDDVKASHGSATGQLDERALFYMRQRGIPEGEARMMLVNAFMTDVLDTIDDDLLRERLRHLVDLRLRGAETVCSGCKNN